MAVAGGVIASYRGGCHCGAIGFVFETGLAPQRWTVRVCQCVFCRAHGARTTSDPAGRAHFVFANASLCNRYRFGQRTADFLVCARCGVYIAALMGDGDDAFATLNVNSIVALTQNLPDATAIDYGDESPTSRLARRRQIWTPVIERM
ncbi:MAG: hypothetical protein ACREP1_05490 [Rhodanobacteraceae bacterium]